MTDAKRVTEAVLKVLKEGRDNLAIYEAIHEALAATPAVGGELGKAIKRLREYASALDGDAYADINEPNLREDIELVCSTAQPAASPMPWIDAEEGDMS